MCGVCGVCVVCAACSALATFSSCAACALVSCHRYDSYHKMDQKGHQRDIAPYEMQQERDFIGVHLGRAIGMPMIVSHIWVVRVTRTYEACHV